MRYIFDTNIFIRSKNEMPMDVWPTFWRKMTQWIQAGTVCSSEEVRKEIGRGKDELTEWMRDNAPETFYVGMSVAAWERFAETQNWAQGNAVYTDGAKRDYASVADAYLVATAAAEAMTLVTYETADPQCRRRVKIPDACNALGVRCCDLNTMLRELGDTI